MIQRRLKEMSSVLSQIVRSPTKTRGIEANMTISDLPEAVHGAPCAIQVIARRFQDEKCLAAARIIDAVLSSSG